jgi:hypothetical protein
MSHRNLGRLGHGYEIRVERVGELVPERHQTWGVENDLPEEWNQFQQEHVGDPDIHAAQIYRSSECRKNMAYRNIQEEFVSRPGKSSWQR